MRPHWPSCARSALRRLWTEVRKAMAPEVRATYSGPILDGKLVGGDCPERIRGRQAGKVPLIIGSNSAEVPAGFVNASSKEELLSLFGSLRDQANAAYDPDGTTDFAEMLTMVNTDKVWAEPARFTARAFAAKGASGLHLSFLLRLPLDATEDAVWRGARIRNPLCVRQPYRPEWSHRGTQGPRGRQDDEHLLGKLRQDR